MNRISTTAVFAFVLTLSASLLGEAQSRQVFEGMRTFATAPQPRASIEGTVVSDATGQPLAGATVTLTRHFDSVLALLSDTDFPNIPPTTTDASGRFAFPAIDPAAYNMTVQMAGHVAGVFGQKVADGRKAALSPAPGQRVEGFNVRLIPSARIGGHVRNRAGEPLAGIPLQLLRTDIKSPQSVVHTTSASDGSYQLDGFLSGDYILLAGSPADVTQEPPVSLAMPVAVTAPNLLTLNLSMNTNRYAVHGKALMRDTGLPPAEASITVSTVGLPGKNRVTLAGAPVEYNAQSGAFEIPNLLPGIYRIARNCGAVDVLITANNVTGIELLDGTCR
jgi:5-hydroxyisourate hydrolase-like protein (transthyretin family)